MTGGYLCVCNPGNEELLMSVAAVQVFSMPSALSSTGSDDGAANAGEGQQGDNVSISNMRRFGGCPRVFEGDDSILSPIPARIMLTRSLGVLAEIRSAIETSSLTRKGPS